ncbi:MAG: hypothetical protein V3U27_03465, partial [Candidatus Tectomicrobia bacterium]
VRHNVNDAQADSLLGNPGTSDPSLLMHYEYRKSKSTFHPRRDAVNLGCPRKAENNKAEREPGCAVGIDLHEARLFVSAFSN